MDAENVAELRRWRETLVTANEGRDNSCHGSRLAQRDQSFRCHADVERLSPLIQTSLEERCPDPASACPTEATRIAPGAARPPRGRVLVVEDDAAIRELLRLHLSLGGFEIGEAGDGRTALERARREAFDIVVLDVMLPGIDGVTLCRSLRAEGPNVDAGILMLTARDTEADKVLGLESGADDYITKPFGVREFMARIGVIVRRNMRSARAPRRAARAHTGIRTTVNTLASTLRLRRPASLLPNRALQPFSRV